MEFLRVIAAQNAASSNWSTLLGEAAGVGPISKKPELVTMDLNYDDADRTSFRQGAASSRLFFGHLHMVMSVHIVPGSALFF